MSADCVPPYGRTDMYFLINMTSSEVLPPNNRLLRYRDISYLVISHDMGYDITTCDITPNHLETPGKYKFNENPPPRCGLLLFFSAVSALILACLPSGFFCLSSVVHQLDIS